VPGGPRDRLDLNRWKCTSGEIPKGWKKDHHIIMAVRSLKTERERGPLQSERSTISAVRQPLRRRPGGDACTFGRLKRTIRNAERRSGDGREIGGTGATILRLRPAPLVRLIEKQRVLGSSPGRAHHSSDYNSEGIASRRTRTFAFSSVRGSKEVPTRSCEPRHTARSSAVG